MRHFDRAVGIALAALSVVSVSGCSAPKTDMVNDPPKVMAPHGPPPKLAEIPPPASAPDSLWRFGHWSWNGGKYIWTAGRYMQRPAPTANWIPGYWQPEGPGWVWTEGHWAS